MTKEHKVYEADMKDQDIPKGMTQVKNYIMTYLVPTMINKSLTFLTPQLSLVYMDLLDQAMEIEAHLRDYGTHKKKHFTAIQSMHQQILDCKGILFHADYLSTYDDFFISFLQTVRIKDEIHKRDGY